MPTRQIIGIIGSFAERPFWQLFRSFRDGEFRNLADCPPETAWTPMWLFHESRAVTPGKMLGRE